MPCVSGGLGALENPPQRDAVGAATGGRSTEASIPPTLSRGARQGQAVASALSPHCSGPSATASKVFVHHSVKSHSADRSA